MEYLLSFLIIGLGFAGMAVGVIFARKTLRKGCSLDPDSCACRKKEEAARSKLEEEEDDLLKIHPKIK